MGEYWDSHDLTEVDAGGPDVEFEIACAVPIEEELWPEVAEAHRRARMPRPSGRSGRSVSPAVLPSDGPVRG